MHNIVNINQLNQLMNSTMIYAVIVFLLAILVAFIICSLIPWQGGHDKSYIKRRVVYIVIGILAVLGFWLYNDLVVLDTIKNAGFQNMFKACNLKCIGITFIGYILVGVIIMFSFRHSKFGSILGRAKK